MIPLTPDLATVLSRLDRLEKQSRFWKGAGLFALLTLGIVLSMGAGQQPAKLSQFDEVQAKRFELVDDKGKLRADLVMSGFGQPALLLYDEKGKERITVRLNKDGNPVISGVVQQQGVSVFQAWDNDGKILFQQPTPDVKCNVLTANRIVVVDAEGRDAFTIGPFLDKAATRSLVIRDLNGKNRLALGMTNYDLVYINVFDKNGKLFKALGQEQPK